MNLLGDPFKLIKPRYDDYGMDRLNYYYTPVVIILMAVTLTAKQYVGEPLQCWVPAQFSKAWEQYAENYCFVYNTYWIRPGEEIPEDVSDRSASALTYYQWVPFIMILEAGLFHFPARIWEMLSKSSGMNIAGMIHAAVKAEEENDDQKMEAAAVNICNLLENSNKMRNLRGVSRIRREFGELNGTYLSNVYLLAKVIYCINSIVQFGLLNWLLNQPDVFWGISVVSDFIHGHNWEDSGTFPRIAMCDFEVRTMGNLQRYSIQCVLIINMFNEKIFVFLYWWIILIGILTFIDSVMHLITIKMPSRRQQFIKRFISCPPEEKAVLDDFTKHYLNPDMFLILKMINAHTSEIVISNILQHLYDHFRNSNATLNEHPYLRHLDIARQESEIYSEDILGSEVQDTMLRQLHIPSPLEAYEYKKYTMQRSPCSR